MSDSSYICPRCYKPLAVLKALGKVRSIDGYLQCVDCYSDLEYESVVVRDIHFKKHREDGTPYPKWLHDDLEAKGLLRKIPVGKGLTKEDKAAIRWAAKNADALDGKGGMPLDKFSKLSHKKQVELICGKNNSKLKKAMKFSFKKVLKGVTPEKLAEVYDSGISEFNLGV